MTKIDIFSGFLGAGTLYLAEIAIPLFRFIVL